jgi:hypothetical protein
MLRKRLESQVTARGTMAFRAKKLAQTIIQPVLSRILQDGKANKTVHVLPGRNDTVWREGLSAKLLEKGVDGPWWVPADLAKSTSQVRGERTRRKHSPECRE